MGITTSDWNCQCEWRTLKPGDMNACFALPHPRGEDRPLPPLPPPALLLTPGTLHKRVVIGPSSDRGYTQWKWRRPHHSCRRSITRHKWFVVPCRRWQGLLTMRACIAEIVHLYPVLGLPKMAEADELSMRWELIHRGRCQVSVCEIGLGSMEGNSGLLYVWFVPNNGTSRLY